MQKVIQIKDAVLKTVKVEIRHVTVNAKQMTLSVFRQLIREPLINAETGELKGVPWGLVNYFWGDCTHGEGHLHIVWQKGDLLRRSCEYKPRWLAMKEPRLRPFVEAMALAGVLESEPKLVHSDGDDQLRWPNGSSISFRLLGDFTAAEIRKFFKCTAQLNQTINNLEYWAGKPTDHYCAQQTARFKKQSEDEQKEIQSSREELLVLYDRIGTQLGWDFSEGVSSKVACQRAAEQFSRLEAIYDLHQKNFATLQTMDQLFIAL